jgi:hypothetical protein
VGTVGLGDNLLKSSAEGRVFVGVDDAGAADDRRVWEEFLDLREDVAVLPLGVGGGDHRGQPERLGYPGEADNVALQFGGAGGVPGAGQQADLVIDEQHDRVVDGRLVVAEPAGGACLGEGNLVRQRGSSNRGDCACVAVCHSGYLSFPPLALDISPLTIRIDLNTP